MYGFRLEHLPGKATEPEMQNKPVFETVMPMRICRISAKGV